MQLDRTAIVIRERDFFEILDLALRVLTRYPQAVCQAWAAVAIPLMAANYFCLRNLVTDYDEFDDVLAYLCFQCLFVVVQAPLVSLLLTTYLGRTVFLQPTRLSDLLRTAGKSALALSWYVGLLRATLLPWFLWRTLPNADPALYVLLFLLATAVIIVRATRSFILEIILLEANPLRAKDPAALTVSRRSRGLHRANTGELLGRWLGSVIIAIGLLGSMVATCWFVSGMVLLRWEWGAVMVQLVIPLALWVTAGFMAIVRFLSYIDMRIRSEGWEIELLVRAAAEQFRDALVA